MVCFLLMFLLVIVAVEANHAISPAEVYWHAVLPNTSMPHAIRQLIDADPKSKRVKVECNSTYVYFMSNATLHTSPAHLLSIFFLKKNIYPGAKIKDVKLIKRNIIGNVFVPRPEADAIPFSSKNLPKILEHFSMSPDSKDAKLMENTITNCEDSPMKGEKKLCSTSLESMIDNVISLLGTTNIQVMATTINGPQHEEKMVYKISSPIKKFSEEDELVICHPQPSPQAVHYCHKNTAYEVSIVPLVGQNGSMVNVVTVCHHDVINSYILEILKVKNSDVEPICHFLPGDHFIWISKN